MEHAWEYNNFWILTWEMVFDFHLHRSTQVHIHSSLWYGGSYYRRQYHNVSEGNYFLARSQINRWVLPIQVQHMNTCQCRCVRVCVCVCLGGASDIHISFYLSIFLSEDTDTKRVCFYCRNPRHPVVWYMYYCYTDGYTHM